MTASRGKKGAAKRGSIAQEPVAQRRQRTGGDLTVVGPRPEGFAEWLTDVKARIHAARQRAALAVNKETLKVYWRIGRDLSRRRDDWGVGVIAQASADLRAAFPEMQGFSPSILKYMRAFAEAWPDFADRQRTFCDLPGGHIVGTPPNVGTHHG